MGIHNIAPVHSRRNIPSNRPISSQRMNVMMEEMLRDLHTIFNTPLPDISGLKSTVDSINSKRFQGVQTVEKLVYGGTDGPEQGDHTTNWREI